MTSGMLIAIAASGLWLYITLDRHPFLSHMLNSPPLGVEWNWQLLANIGLFLLVAGLGLFAQVFPEGWTWLWSVLQTTTHSGQ